MLNLAAVSKPWCVIFDQTLSEDIEKTLEASYSAERIAAPTRFYRQMMTTIWQPILKCVAGTQSPTKHGVALYMLDEIREQTIQLAAMNYDIDTANYAEVDQLPEMLLIKLRHTLPTSTSNVSIRRALRTTLVLFFQQAGIARSKN